MVKLDHNPDPEIPGTDAYPIATDSDDLDRETLLEAFVFVLNVCEPDHHYETDPYPVALGDIKYGYKQARSSTWVSCGPRKQYRPNVVTYSVDKTYFQRHSLERLLAVNTHEVTHVTEGLQTDGGMHSPQFWQEMAFNAHHMLDAWDSVAEAFPTVDRAQYLEEVVIDVNHTMTDKRYETRLERRCEQCELLGVTPEYNDDDEIIGIEETDS